RVFRVVRDTLPLEHVGPWQRRRLTRIDRALRVPHSRQVRLAFSCTRYGPEGRRMWSGLGDSEVAPVSQRVQLKIEEVDVETQRLSRRNDHVLLRVQIEPGRGNRQIVSAGRQLRD